MKKHLIKLTIFLLGLLALIQCIVIRNNPYLKNKVNYQQNILKMSEFNSAYLIVGDSHAGMISQSQLDKRMYNLGMASDSMNEIYIKIDYAIKHNPNFKYLLLTADYHILSKYRDAFNNKAYIRPFSTPENYPLIYNESYHRDYVADTLSQYALFDFNVYVTARMRLISKLKGLIKGKAYQQSKNKQWIEHPRKERNKRAKERAKIHFTRIMTDNNAKRYKDIVQLCKNHNITIIGLRYPLSKEYRQNMKKYDINKMDDFFSGIEFDLFLDYSGLIDDMKYFNDMDHLNENGVEILLQSLYIDTL